MTIGQAARALAIPATTLRYYESCGVIPRAERRNGRRVYDEAIVERVRLARFAQSVGFSLAEVRVLLAEGEPRSATWRKLALRKMAELDEIVAASRRMKRAIAAGLRCGCLRAEDCR